jgi:SAM-dependent methyltransferase
MDPRASPEPGSTNVLRLLTGPLQARFDNAIALRYVSYEDKMYVLAAGRRRPRWSKIILRSPGVRWRVGTQEFVGTARLIQEGDLALPMVLAKFNSEFGADQIRRWFGSKVLLFCLETHSEPTTNYRSQVRTLFDLAAGNYDRLVGANLLDRHLRVVSLGLLQRTFRSGDRILEIGCGTGLETLPLAKAGVEVVAIDISREMTKKLEEKARSVGLGRMVHVRNLGASQLDSVLSEFGAGAFQGAFSDFGALNCEPDWRKTPYELYQLLERRGNLILGVWNRVCLMELLLYTLRLNPSRAFSRFRSPVPLGMSRFGVPVFPITPTELHRQFSDYFTPQELIGLPVLIPPYDFARRLSQMQGLVFVLQALDRRLQSRFPFNHMGDHSLVRMTRK